jgi:outer membrane receptor protein involved in Fe transport
LVQAFLSTHTAEDFTLVLATQFHHAYERYRDPDLSVGGNPLDTYFLNQDIRAEPRGDLRIGSRARVSAGVELGRTTAEGKSLQADVARNQAGTFLAGEIVLVNAGNLVQGVTAYPAIRHDAFSGLTPAWSPQFGIRMDFNRFNAGALRNFAASVRSTFSRNFRVPTFNELYFQGGGGSGNPALHPERSTSFDLGASVKFDLVGEHHTQVTYFVNDMRDRIIWSPAGGNTVFPRNLRHVRSTGIESSYRWEAPGKVFNLQVSYTSADTRKTSVDYPGDPTFNTQLPFVPLEMLSLRGHATARVDDPVIKELAAVVTYAYASHRFSSEDNKDFIPSHQVAGACLMSRFVAGALLLTTKFEVNNLFGEEYEVMVGYPMPLRSYRLTLALEYR